MFSFKIAHSRLQQVAQGDYPEELAGTVTCDHGQPHQPSLSHSVDHDTQWFVWIRHHGMLLNDLSKLATVMVLWSAQEFLQGRARHNLCGPLGTTHASEIETFSSPSFLRNAPSQHEYEPDEICYVDNGSDMEEGCHVALCPSEAKCHTP